ncbi:MAG TPA: hypothetical protein VF114_01425 [Candidatus Limnocylindria bacterium]
MRVGVLSRDLILASRILGQASSAGHEAELVGDPSALPPADALDLLFVNWGDRQDSWGAALAAWCDSGATRARLVLYGPHTDLEGHAAAKAAGLGPMLARSKLVADLPSLFAA